MDEFVRRPVSPQNSRPRSVLDHPVQRADASMPDVQAPPEEKPVNENPMPKKPSKKKFSLKNFKLPTPKTKKQWIIFCVIAALILGATSYAVYWFVIRDTSEPIAYIEPEPEPEPEPTTGQSSVSGREVPLSKIKQPIYSVQIENSPEARPQSGLVDADIVMEAIAEGGITRFNAIYHDKVPANLGPVRSMRPYFIDWFLPYNAGAVHAGGSPQALSDIVSLDVQDMNHDSANFRRVSNRYAPHNLYTTGKQMIDLFNSKGYKNGDYKGLTRKPLVSDQESDPAEQTSEDGVAAEAPKKTPATTINLNISRALYNVSFTWNKESNNYARTMGGGPHVDADSGKRISPEVVVVPVLTRSTHPNGIHTAYGTTGSGTLFVFQDGEVIKGTWKKPSRSAQWQLLDANNKPIELNPGQTWFTIMDNPGSVSY